MQYIIVLLLLFSTNLFATIINIPDDVRTIQGGIYRAEDGDTVLVQPGSYAERINFRGKAITVGSLILITGDEAYIDSTIIDGNERGPVVTFESQEDTTSILCGFTIQNGVAEDGGGVYLNAGPLLENLLITGNLAERYGGGIYCVSEILPYIRNCVITGNISEGDGGGICGWVRPIVLSNVTIIENHAESSGGGIYLMDTGAALTFEHGLIKDNSAELGGGMYQVCGQTATLNYVDIINNEATCGGGFYVSGWSRLYLTNSVASGNIADETGGGFHLQGERDKILTNVSVVNNRAETGNAIYSTEDSQNTIVNCIFWYNDDVSVIGDADCYFTISYSDFENGCDGVIMENEDQFEWGEGVIDSDPLFINENDDDYRLTLDSPCIDSGDPNFPPDADSTRADMGGRTSMQFGHIFGTILSAATNEPLVNAHISLSDLHCTYSDSSGYWSLDIPAGNYELTATCRGYNDSTITDMDIDLNEIIEIEFRLLHPEIEFSHNEIDIDIPRGESRQIDFSLSNNADGNLYWSVRKDFSAWALRESFPLAQELEDSRILSAAFIDDQFYVTGAGNDTNFVYVLSRELEFVERFRQPGSDSWGLRDLTFDGENLWGTDGDSVFCFTLDGDSVNCWQIEDNWSSAISIAWDSDREILWMGSISNGISGFDRAGNRIRELSNVDDIYIYGLVYWSSDPDGFPLYILHHNRETGVEAISKINPETDDTLSVVTLDNRDVRDMHSLFITDQYSPAYRWVILNIRDASLYEGGDRLEIRDLADAQFWYHIEPDSGTVLPDETEEFTLTLNTLNEENDYVLAEDVYESSLIFSHNADGFETIIPVVLRVSPNGVEQNNYDTVPVAAELNSAFPNPFNSVVSIKYALDKSLDISLKIYDISGREVVKLVDGYSDAGFHSVTWQASDYPSGLYLIKMEAGSFSDVRKVMLIR